MCERWYAFELVGWDGMLRIGHLVVKNDCQSLIDFFFCRHFSATIFCPKSTAILQHLPHQHSHYFMNISIALDFDTKRFILYPPQQTNNSTTTTTTHSPRNHDELFFSAEAWQRGYVWYHGPVMNHTMHTAHWPPSPPYTCLHNYVIGTWMHWRHPHHLLMKSIDLSSHIQSIAPTQASTCPAPRFFGFTSPQDDDLLRSGWETWDDDHHHIKFVTMLNPPMFNRSSPYTYHGKDIMGHILDVESRKNQLDLINRAKTWSGCCGHQWHITNDEFTFQRVWHGPSVL